MIYLTRLTAIIFIKFSFHEDITVDNVIIKISYFFQKWSLISIFNTSYSAEK